VTSIDEYRLPIAIDAWVDFARTHASISKKNKIASFGSSNYGLEAAQDCPLIIGSLIEQNNLNSALLPPRGVTSSCIFPHFDTYSSPPTKKLADSDASNFSTPPIELTSHSQLAASLDCRAHSCHSRRRSDDSQIARHEFTFLIAFDYCQDAPDVMSNSHILPLYRNDATRVSFSSDCFPLGAVRQLSLASISSTNSSRRQVSQPC